MISMRYAANLAHGHGLTWNPGERVEGFTNPLWTLVMALAALVFSQTGAVLAMHILGASLLAASAWIFASIAGRLFRGSPPMWVALFEGGFFWLLTETFPLRFWTHMGMEVAGLLLSSALAWRLALRPPRPLSDGRVLGSIGVLMAIAFLLRPDGVLVALAPALLSLSRGRPTARRAVAIFAPLAFAVVTTTVLRHAYYGEWVPNTYRLKMGRFPIGFRLVNGLGFVEPYLRQVALFVGLGALACVLHRTRRVLWIAAAPAMLLGYQIYVGGDPWTYWRQLTPGYPLLLLLCIHPVVVVSARLRRRFRRARHLRVAAPVVALALLAGCLGPTWIAFGSGWPLTFNAAWNRSNVARALLFREILKPDARIAVTWGGTTPYYDADRYVIDILGKCDRVVADEPPDLSGALAGEGMQTVPGHNKSKLAHSVVAMHADYTESVRLGRDQLAPEDLVQLKRYTLGGRDHWFRRDSARVDWAALEAVLSAEAH